jgi:FlaA1/EpsC-like NDP-sugar epimerase
VMGSSVATRRLIMVMLDLLVCAAATIIAFWLRIGAMVPEIGPAVILFALSAGAWLLLAWQSGTYRSIVRYTGRATLIRLAFVAAFQALMLSVLFLVQNIPGIPRTLAVIQPLVMLTGTVVLRVVIRQMLADSMNRSSVVRAERRIVVFGAGEAGQRAIAVLRSLPSVRVLAILDDDPRRHGSQLDGVPIYRAANLPSVIDQYAADEVVLAIPNATKARRRAILMALTEIKVRVRTLPDLANLMSGAASVAELTDIDPAELLGREAVRPDLELLNKVIAQRTVMITGAGGSIGREIAEQALLGDPDRLVLVEVSEPALYQAEQRLLKLLAAKADAGRPTALILELANCADRGAMARLYKKFRPETVFHAAAYKHVPMLEANPVSGVGNNVFGTLNCVQMARRFGTKNFVLVSTDKAVRPTNVMGASKRVCELILQAKANEPGDTIFSMVRFGNVLNSSGSVVPKFSSQIAVGGPVTLTDRRITRYFMTIPEAAQLVIQAGGMSRGGEVFLLDMGEPVHIIELARTMIQLQGLTVRSIDNPSGDIEIVEIGLRPGEKLYEELLIDDTAMPTRHVSIFQANEGFLPWSELEPVLNRLSAAVKDGDGNQVVAILLELVPEFVRERDARVPAQALT